MVSALDSQAKGRGSYPSTVEYRVSARHRVSAHPVIFSLEGNSSLLRTISGKRPPIDFSG